MSGLDRRSMLGGTAALGMALAVPGRPKAAQTAEFRIWRHGEDIGRHSLAFEQAADGLHVSSFVNIEVKIAFITAFKFRQEARDHWRDGILVRSRVETDDDGEHSLTELQTQEESVIIDGPKGFLEAPKGVMTDVCFWNPDIVGQQRLLDTGKGEFHPVESHFVGEETLELPDGPRKSKRFQMSSVGGRSGDIWFDKDGVWVGARLTTRGETLEYEKI